MDSTEKNKYKNNVMDSTEKKKKIKKHVMEYTAKIKISIFKKDNI